MNIRYVRQSLVLPTEHHNPTVQVSPGGDGNSWNLYTIADWDGPVTVTTSTDHGISWSTGGDDGGGGATTEQTVMPHNNPGPVLNKDGSMLMYYRFETELEAPTCSMEAIGMQRCASARGPCRGDANSGSSKPLFKHTAEDPSVFVDVRGNFHMLVNALPYACAPKTNQGGHAWSKDGVTWSEPRVGAFNTTVTFTDGAAITCERRERPQMIMDPETNRPLVLMTAVFNCPPFGDGIYAGGNDDSFTLAQEML